MAEFDPEVSNLQPNNFLGYSRGSSPVDADKSKATAIQTVGETIENGIKGGVSLFETEVKAQTRDAVEGVRADWNDSLNIANSNRPGDLQRGMDRLGGMTSAKNAGSMRESHYWNMLDMESRRLKAKFPGFKDEVDNHISKLAGTTPANRLLQELLSEHKAGQSDTVKEYAHWEKRLIEQGGGVEVVARKNAGKPMTLAEIQMASAVIDRNKYQGEVARHQIAEQKSRGELNRQTARDTAQKDIGFTVSSIMQGSLQGSGITSYKDMAEKWQRMSQNKQGPYTEEEQNGIRTEFGRFRSSTMTAVMNQIAQTNEQGFSYDQVLHPEDKKTIIEGVKAQLDVMEDALVNKNFGILVSNQARTEAMKNEDIASVLMRPDGAARKVQVLKELFGPAFLASSLMDDPKFLSDVVKTITTDTKFKVLTGGQPGGEAIPSITERFAELKKGGVTDRQAYTQIVEDGLTAIKADDVPPAAKLKYAEHMFGPGNKDFLTYRDSKGNVQPKFDDPHAVYLKMATDPKVIENMYALKDSNPEVWNNFKNFVVGSFSPMMTMAANDAQRVVVNSRYQDLTWDPVNFQFNLAQTKPYPVENATVTDLAERFINDPNSKASVDKLNQTIRGIVPLIVKDGQDPAQVVPQLVQSLNIDMNRTKQGPGLSTLWEQAVNKIRTTVGKEPSSGAGSREGSRSQDVAPLMDFIGRLESGKHGYTGILGGNEPKLTGMTVNEVFEFQKGMRNSGKESTAVGKYQFIEKTLKDVVKTLGIDPAKAKFTPELQDAMALELLKRRGLDDFMSGKKDFSEFQHELSKEWASLPNPKTGDSFYKGTGSNRALTNSDEVVKVLEGVSGRKNAQVTGTPQFREGQTASDPSGNKIVFKSGKWQSLQ